MPFNLARPLWVDDERFDLDFHLRRAAIPSPGGRAQLERAVGRVLSRPLDRAKPLWELYVFEGLAEDRTAVLLKLHHALADGIGGMLIGSALFDLEPDTPLGPEPKTRWVPTPAPTRDELLSDAIREVFLHPAEAVGQMARAPSRALDVVGETIAGMRSLAGMGPPPSGPFDAEIGPARRFGTAEVPFARLREIKRALGGTVNDVVLTAIAGGLHSLLAERGEPTRDRTLRVMVPVSVRSRAEAGDVGNRVAPAFVDIPVGKMAPATRFAESARRHRGPQVLIHGGVGRFDHRTGCVRAAGVTRDGGSPRLASPVVQRGGVQHPRPAGPALHRGGPSRRELSRDAAR